MLISSTRSNLYFTKNKKFVYETIVFHVLICLHPLKQFVSFDLKFKHETCTCSFLFCWIIFWIIYVLHELVAPWILTCAVYFAIFDFINVFFFFKICYQCREWISLLVYYYLWCPRRMPSGKYNLFDLKFSRKFWHAH